MGSAGGWGVLPGQVRQRGCLCRVSPDLPLQDGHANPAETPAVGTVPRKLEVRGKCLAVMSLGQNSVLFLSLWVLAVPSVLPSLVLGEDSYNCLRDKSSSVPPQLPSQIQAIPFNVCRAVPVHTLCWWERIGARSVEKRSHV